jgi:hypothetical protein
VQSDFNRVTVDNGMLKLLTPKDKALSIDIMSDAIRAGAVPYHGLPVAVPFVRVPPPRETRLELWVAKWADGSRIYLDSRGMLHLRSADRTLPEVSLVLTKADLAGWSSDGNVFGPRQFIGDGRESTPLPFNVAINAFIVRLRAP